MQALTNSNVGEIYTIKWMFGLPEVLKVMEKHNIEEGREVQIIQKVTGGLILGAGSSRLAISDEVAERIKV